MALIIRNLEAEKLAAELAAQTGKSEADVIVEALRDRVTRVRNKNKDGSLVADLAAIAEHCAKLPVLDSRSEEEILGYGECGLPGR